MRNTGNAAGTTSGAQKYNPEGSSKATRVPNGAGQNHPVPGGARPTPTGNQSGASSSKPRPQSTRPPYDETILTFSPELIQFYS
eukprot:CAMPEP_0115031668 /NCGR_PEP_ID=MMETSP0216-20121206/38679_1 /TAXON_ID=223996 /ORGANISM="Protocruzia adherens, Strain Boccale" /LENGTH=83 /DNA_ID=CAMNT_0002409379 /DNA_START=244 /DNA_END=491 /DNA_ORIENTATION=-